MLQQSPDLPLDNRLASVESHDNRLNQHEAVPYPSFGPKEMETETMPAQDSLCQISDVMKKQLPLGSIIIHDLDSLASSSRAIDV
jgi:hypothetical protein